MFEGQGSQAFGLTGTGASTEFAGVVNRGGVLQAGVRDATGTWQFAPLPRRVRDLIGEPISVTVIHRSDRVQVRVEDAAAVTLPRPSGTVRVGAIDRVRGDGALRVSWLRASSARTSGTYVSSVMDALQIVTWDRAFWEADVPTGTQIRVAVRTGMTPAPDGTWSSWSEVPSSGASLAGMTEDSRYLQYRVQLATNDPAVTPTLRHIGFSHNGDLELHGETGEGRHE